MFRNALSLTRNKLFLNKIRLYLKLMCLNGISDNVLLKMIISIEKCK